MCVTALALGCAHMLNEHGVKHIMRTVEAGEGDRDYEAAAPDLQLISAEEYIQHRRSL